MAMMLMAMPHLQMLENTKNKIMKKILLPLLLLLFCVGHAQDKYDKTPNGMQAKKFKATQMGIVTATDTLLTNLISGEIVKISIADLSLTDSNAVTVNTASTTQQILIANGDGSNLDAVNAANPPGALTLYFYTEDLPIPIINCVLSEWSEYSSCDGQSTQTRTRTIITQPSGGGMACGALIETINCSLEPDPEPEPVVNCVLSEWSAYSSCSGQSTQTRTRTIITPASGGGQACGILSETINCPPVNCVLSEWSVYSSCDGQSTQTRTRTVITPGSNGGTSCGILSETIDCPLEPDPDPNPNPDPNPEPIVNCVLSEWSAYSSCSGQSTQTRTRTVITPESGGGVACGALSETINCPPVDCVLSEWSAYSSCDGQNTQTRTRTVVTPASNGGAACGVLSETIGCPIVAECLSYDIRNDEQEELTFYYYDCNNQYQPVIIDGLQNLLVCANQAPQITSGSGRIIQYGSCGDPQPEPEPVVNCVLSAWSEWSSCVNNSREKTRTVITPASGGGTACGPLIWSEDCLLTSSQQFPMSNSSSSTDLEACNLFELISYWHDGTEDLPSMGNRVYSSSTTGIPINGQNRWFKMQSEFGNAVIQIGTNGVVLSNAPCGN